MNLPHRTSRQGFTLVELLVVVAIIALLLGILLPALGKARGLAQSVKCQSSVRAMGQANQAYTVEYNQAVVPILQELNVGRRWWYQNVPFQRMIAKTDEDTGSDRLNPGFLCPVAADVDVDEDGARLRDTYGSNSTSLKNNPGWNQPGNIKFFRISEAVSPSVTMQFVDARSAEQLNIESSKNPSNAPVLVDTSAQDDRIVYRHGSGAANVAFIDGHAEAVDRDKISTTKNDPNEKNHTFWYILGK